MTNDPKRDDKEIVGENIQYAREALYWKQQELADRAGISRATIAKIESGSASGVSISTISTIAEALGVPVYMLFLRDVDWKNLVKVFDAGAKAEEYKRAAGAILPEDVARIEAMSISSISKENRTAVADTKLIVCRIFGVDPRAKTGDADRSKSAGMGMAVKRIPSAPILNGLIASMISA